MSKRTEIIEEYPYLDKGFVQLIGHYGNDRKIAAAARASFDADAYKSDEANKNLIDYLCYHSHMSPLEMGLIHFNSKIPIFVMRQHVRHRTFKLNEASLRYITHDGDYYLPSLERMQYQATDTKQGSGEVMPPHLAQTYRDMMSEALDLQWKQYKRMLREEDVEYIQDGKTKTKIVAQGLTKELSRTILGTAFYTTVTWQGDLRNLANYLFLRLESHAQWEIQQHAKIVDQVYQKLFPYTYEAFRENLLDAVRFSGTEMSVVRDAVNYAFSHGFDISDDNLTSTYGMRESRIPSFLSKLQG